MDPDARSPSEPSPHGWPQRWLSRAGSSHECVLSISYVPTTRCPEGPARWGVRRWECGCRCAGETRWKVVTSQWWDLAGIYRSKRLCPRSDRRKIWRGGKREKGESSHTQVPSFHRRWTHKHVETPARCTFTSWNDRRGILFSEDVFRKNMLER